MVVPAELRLGGRASLQGVGCSYDAAQYWELRAHMAALRELRLGVRTSTHVE